MGSITTTSQAPLNIVIVGGSLSSLFTGIALKSLSQVASITIVERLRESQLQDLGAGIRCNEEVNDAIYEFLGVKPESYAAFLNVYRSYDSKGRQISQVDTVGWTTTWGQLYRLLKGGFEGNIGDWDGKATAKCTYRLSCTLFELQKLDVSNGEVDDMSSRLPIRVTFENENSDKESILADLVIGADGASSTVRSLILPEVHRTTAPYLCYRGVISPSLLSPEIIELYHRAGIFTWPGRDTGQFVSYVVPGNDDHPDESTHCVNWLLYCNKTADEIQQVLTDKDGKLHQFSLPRGKMSDTELEKLWQEAEETLPDIHVDLVKRTKDPFVQLVTDSLTTNNAFWDGRILLVGDAVGGQRPHAASALMQAIYHGLQLRLLLCSQISLTEWTTRTQNLTRILVNTGQEMGDILMGKVIPPKEKIPLYMESFMRTQRELDVIWKETVGIGKAVPKF